MTNIIDQLNAEQMQGNIKKQMVAGIDNAQCVVVFITKRYTEKVSGDNAEDNCQLEFNYSALRKTAARMVAVVMEERMRDTRAWLGEVAMTLGGRLYVDMCGDLSNEAYLHAKCKELSDAILGVIGTPVSKFNLQLGQHTTHTDTKPANTSADADKNHHAKVAMEKSSNNSTSHTATKPLAQLTIVDVGHLLDNLNLNDYKGELAKNSINGECLAACESGADVKEIGISMAVKAKMFYNKVVEFRDQGVPLDLLVDQAQVAAEQKAKAEAEAKQHAAQVAAEQKAKAEADAKQHAAQVAAEQKAKAEAEHAAQVAAAAKKAKAEADAAAQLRNPGEAELHKRQSLKKPRCTRYHDMKYTATDSGESYSTWACDICGKSASRNAGTLWAFGRYHCIPCKSDFCTSCYDKAGADNPPVDQKGHLTQYTLNQKGCTSDGYKNGWHCDVCQTTTERSSAGINGRFLCLICHADFCNGCVRG